MVRRARFNSVPDILAGTRLQRTGAGYPASFLYRLVQWQAWVVGENRAFTPVIPIKAPHLFAPKHYSYDVILHVLLFYVSLVESSLIRRARQESRAARHPVPA